MDSNCAYKKFYQDNGPHVVPDDWLAIVCGTRNKPRMNRSIIT